MAHPDRVRKAYEGLCVVCLTQPGSEQWQVDEDGTRTSLGFKCVFCVLGCDPASVKKRLDKS